MQIKEKIEQVIRESVNKILLYSAHGIGKLSFADITQKTKHEMNELGCNVLGLIVATLETTFDANRDKHRIVIRNKNKKRKLLTEMGEVEIKHTLYFDKQEERYFFAVDELLELEKRSRIEKGMKAKLVSDAVITSYGKAAKIADNTVSRQTVYNIVKSLEEIEAPYTQTNRDAADIFIEADEDHIHLNTGKPAEVKLVYVHEGRENTKERP